MALPLVAAGLSALNGLTRIVQGIRQNKEAKKLRPSNFIPPSLRESLGRLRSYASSTLLPGYNRAKENINQSTSNAIRAAGSGSISDKLNAAQSANISENDALSNLNDAGAQFQLSNQDRLTEGLNRKARVEENNQRVFEQTKRQLLDAGSQNIYGGLLDAATVGTVAAGGGFSNSNIQAVKMMPTNEFMNFYKNSYDPTAYSPSENLQIKELYNKTKKTYIDHQELSKQGLPTMGKPNLPFIN